MILRPSSKVTPDKINEIFPIGSLVQLYHEVKDRFFFFGKVVSKTTDLNVVIVGEYSQKIIHWPYWKVKKYGISPELVYRNLP